MPSNPQPFPLPKGSCSLQQHPNPMPKPLAPQCLGGRLTQVLGWFGVNRSPAPSPAWDQLGAAPSWQHLPIPPGGAQACRKGDGTAAGKRPRCRNPMSNRKNTRASGGWQSFLRLTQFPFADPGGGEGGKGHQIPHPPHGPSPDPPCAAGWWLCRAWCPPSPFSGKLFGYL